MCKAVEDLILMSKAEGEAKGRAEGEAKGRAEGRTEGRAEGENNIIKKMRAAGMSEEQIRAILAVEPGNAA